MRAYLLSKEKDIGIDPLTQVLGLFCFCLLSLFIRTLPVLVLYLYMPILALLFLNPHFFKARALWIEGAVFLIFSLLLCWGSMTGLNVMTVNTIRALLRFLILTAAGILIISILPICRFIDLLERLRLPFYVTFALTVALRFFPLMLREIRLIKENMYGRGAIRWGWFLHPYESGRSLFIPIVIRALKKADALALAATARGFGAPVQRSYRDNPSFGKGDFLFSLIVLSLSSFFLIFDIWARGIGRIG